MADESYRELQYVECRTFNGNKHVKMDLKYYMPNEAYSMYNKVIDKYKGTAVKMLVCQRKENHELIRCFSLGFDAPPAKKKKSTRF